MCKKTDFSFKKFWYQHISERINGRGLVNISKPMSQSGPTGEHEWLHKTVLLLRQFRLNHCDRQTDGQSIDITVCTAPLQADRFQITADCHSRRVKRNLQPQENMNLLLLTTWPHFPVVKTEFKKSRLDSLPHKSIGVTHQHRCISHTYFKSVSLHPFLQCATCWVSSLAPIMTIFFKTSTQFKRLSEAIRGGIFPALMPGGRLTGPAARSFLSPEESPSAGHITRASPGLSAAVSLPLCNKAPHTADTWD